ncbi:hypothetical protein BC835DRAFT_1524063 [Cytidiella melzeri]|nr:hypothetical protein BC835DRAFT_1524063 [Cytidiella melzeri]
MHFSTPLALFAAIVTGACYTVTVSAVPYGPYPRRQPLNSLGIRAEPEGLLLSLGNGKWTHIPNSLLHSPPPEVANSITHPEPNYHPAPARSVTPPFEAAPPNPSRRPPPPKGPMYIPDGDGGYITVDPPKPTRRKTTSNSYRTRKQKSRKKKAATPPTRADTPVNVLAHADTEG